MQRLSQSINNLSQKLNKQNKFIKNKQHYPMKSLKVLLCLLSFAIQATAQCYSKIVSHSRCYIALQTDGTLWAKGAPFQRGVLGFGNSNAVAEFTQIGTDNNWTENISINNTNTFAIKTDGTLWVWGKNTSYPAAGLGTNDNIGYFIPRQIGTDNNWASVSGGSGFTIATKTDGTLWAWGSNSSGKLGIGNTDNNFTTSIPIQVGTDTNWARVYTGDTNLAYAIKTDGTLWSWGNNGNYIGYAGASQNDNYRAPHQIGTDRWLNIAVGLSGPMTFGIKIDGSLWGWGNSAGVQYFFGNGVDIYSSQTPEQIGVDTDWKQVCLGQHTTIALKNNGTRWGWGRNDNGYQLGMGSTGDVTVPTQLDTANDWRYFNMDLFDTNGDGIKTNNSLNHWGGDHLNIIRQTPNLFGTVTCTLSVDNFDQTYFSAFPNPFNEFIKIRFKDDLHLIDQVKIINALGEELLLEKIEIVNQEATLNLSHIATGVYFLSLKINERTYVTKLIKN